MTKKLSGQTFGRLTAVSPEGKIRSDITWRCSCSCGGSALVTASNLVLGVTKSCGCLVRENAKANGKASTKHGMTGTPEHQVWMGMLARCEQPSHTSYHKYGAKGVTVCPEWYDFATFLKDMGPRPEGMTLEREDGTKGYSASNCKWATLKEQNCNREGVVMLTHEGITDSRNGWATRLGIPSTTLYRQLATKTLAQIIESK